MFVTAVCASPAAKAFETGWSGFSIGGNAGYGFSQQRTMTSIADGPLPACHFCDGFTGGNDTTIAAGTGAQRLRPDGFNGGVQIGWNRQSGRWVYGIEADFGAFGVDRTSTVSATLPANTALSGGGGVCGNSATTVCVANTSITSRADWLATFRPRLGLIFDRTLVYATGGLALTHLRYSQTYTDNITYFLVPGGTGAGGFAQMSAQATKTGFTVGGGFEQRFADRWSVKGEYLYTQFGGLNASAVLSDGVTPVVGSFANFASASGTLSTHLVRLGVNYRLTD